MANPASAAAAEPVPAAEMPARRFWPEGWWRLVDIKIGIIPLPVYLILAILLAVLTSEGEIKPDAPTMIAVLALGGFTCAEIGKRLPLLKTIGAGAIFATFIPSALVYYMLIPTPLVKAIADFHQVHQLPLPVYRHDHRRQYPGHGPGGADQGLPEDLRAPGGRLRCGGLRGHAGRHPARPRRLSHVLFPGRPDHGRRRRRGGDPALPSATPPSSARARATCSRRFCLPSCSAA